MKKHKSMKTRMILFCMLVFSTSILSAKIRVSSMLGANMVLQSNSEVKLWGKADPNQRLNFAIGWSKEKINISANEKGDWLVKVKTVEAGGPYTLALHQAKKKYCFKISCLVKYGYVPVSRTWKCPLPVLAIRPSTVRQMHC